MSESVIGADCLITVLDLRGHIVDFDSVYMNYTVICGNEEWIVPIWMIEVTE